MLLGTHYSGLYPCKRLTPLPLSGSSTILLRMIMWHGTTSAAAVQASSLNLCRNDGGGLRCMVATERNRWFPGP